MYHRGSDDVFFRGKRQFCEASTSWTSKASTVTWIFVSFKLVKYLYLYPGASENRSLRRNFSIFIYFFFRTGLHWRQMQERCCCYQEYADKQTFTFTRRSSVARGWQPRSLRLFTCCPTESCPPDTDEHGDNYEFREGSRCNEQALLTAQPPKELPTTRGTQDCSQPRQAAPHSATFRLASVYFKLGIPLIVFPIRFICVHHLQVFVFLQRLRMKILE